jgi:hypothetical protein
VQFYNHWSWFILLSNWYVHQIVFIPLNYWHPTDLCSLPVDPHSPSLLSFSEAIITLNVGCDNVVSIILADFLLCYMCSMQVQLDCNEKEILKETLVDCDRIMLHLVYPLLTAIVSFYTWCIPCWLRSYHATLGVSLVDCDRIMLHLVYPLLTAIVSCYTWCIPCWLRSYHSTLGVSLVDCDRIILHLVYPFNIWWQLLGSILSKDLRIHLIIAVYIFPNQGIQCPSL